MGLTDENGGMNTTMLVSPTGAYQGGGNGGFGDMNNGGWWILLLFILLGGNNWNNGYGGGFGGGNNQDFPWLINGQHAINNNVNDGFRDAQLHNSVTSVRDGINSLSTQLCGCCGDVQMGLAGVNQGIASAAAGIQNSLCNGFAGTTAAITAAQNGVTQQLYNNEIASLNRSFAEQTANSQGFNGLTSQLAQCCCDNRLATCQTQNIVQNEGNATRFADANNTRDIIEAQNRGTQAILDKLCALELDGVKGQLAQAQRENVALQNAVNMANMQASQVEQTAQIRAAQATTANQLVNELRSCPIPSQPVYGNQPIFTCPQNAYNNNGCGCGCNGGFAN